MSKQRRKHFKSIDDLENDVDNNLACGLWDECFDENDGEHLMCPWCGNSIELEAEDLWELEELKEYKYECPECEQTIYFRAEPTVNLYSKREPDDPDEAIEIY